MASKVQSIPKGYTEVTPYLTIKGAEDAISFYKKVFGAKETGRINTPDGNIAHAELQIGEARIMLAEENIEWGSTSPQKLGGSSVGFCLYVDNVDDIYEKALNEGAKASGSMEVKDEFFGDRVGSVVDPFGHKWMIMKHIEDVSFEEMQKRSNAMFAEFKPA